MPGGFCGKKKDYDGNDNFITTKEDWKAIEDYLPKDKIIYEPFYCDGKSGLILKELGCNQVIHQNVDFFENTFNYDYIISNPPFSIKRQILDKLYEIDKPFILIMPMEILNYKYFQKWLNKIQLIFPKKRMNFYRPNGELKKFNYDCIYFCYKLNLERDIILLN
jgi:hypothetical protein